MKPHLRSLMFALLAAPALSFAASDPAAASDRPAQTAPADDDGSAKDEGPSNTSKSDAPADPDTADLARRIAELEKQQEEAKKKLGFWDKLKFSGYVQARYQWAENSLDGAVNGSSAVRDGFTVRRGRLKATYEGSWSKYVLQIDAVPRGVSLRDAEAWLIEPWTGHKLALVLGQMKWPFGYESVQSSKDRELPERSRVVRAFLPSERDRGLKFAGKLGWFNFGVGVFNGNGIENRANVGERVVDFGSGDNDREKDIVGRLGFDLKSVSGGVSGWWGQTLNPDPASRVYFDRNRLGADLQVALELIPAGATVLKGEYIWGHTWQRDGIEQFGVPASGWYALLVQNLGPKNAVAVRYDYFDPSLGTASAADAADPTRPASANPVGTLGAGVVHYWDPNLKLSAFYEVPLTSTPGDAQDPNDDLFTLQFQAGF